MIQISPIDVLLWNLRHNERDIIQIYDKLAPLMKLGADSDILNFGLWDKDAKDPLEAQKRMCEYVGDFGLLGSSKKLLDVGSGYCSPALLWKEKFPKLEIVCLNLNFSQLNQDVAKKHVGLVNSTSSLLPCGVKSFDRIVALESAHHFKQIGSFFRESRRVITDDGIFVIAMPVINNQNMAFLKLGILNLTWTSIHYSKEFVKSQVKKAGFKIQRMQEIGSFVYEPLVDYYIANRENVKRRFYGTYSSRIENLVFHSMQKMKKLSSSKTIEYLMMELVPS